MNLKSLSKHHFFIRNVKMIPKLALITLLITTSMVIFANQESFASTNTKTLEPYTELLYTVNVGTEKYVIHFNVCAGEEAIEFPEILIKSSLDAVQMKSTKSIYPHSCHSYESTINAKYPNTITITLI